MSLFFNERIDEQQKKDPLKKTITFTYSWIITIPPANGDIYFSEVFRTNYKYCSVRWCLLLSRNRIYLYTDSHVNENLEIWNGTNFIFYNLYSDNDIKLLLYSSPQIEMTKPTQDSDSFVTSAGFLTKLKETFNQRKLAKIVVLVELHLPSQYFCRPFDMPSCDLGKEKCDEVPADAESDYRFEFLKENDFTIKCPNGLMPASRMMLHISSSLMKNWFKNSVDKEYSIEHSINVVKPVIIYLHTRCFQMPKVYDLDFAKHLLEAIDFFEPEHGDLIINVIHLSLCQKFIQEPHNFDSILQWISIAYRHSLEDLEDMIATVVADKFYFKWHETFPQDTRNAANPIFRDTFGSDDKNQSKYFFKKIDDFKKYSVKTNVILD